ncbi:hypothetical protein EXW15_13675 [Enterococcus faecium]|nr:hypothetical protein [Enterococcus faecium]
MVHSDSDLILHNSSVLIDKEPIFVSAPVCLSIKKSGEDDGSGFVGNRADFIICFYITCGFDF